MDTAELPITGILTICVKNIKYNQNDLFFIEMMKMYIKHLFLYNTYFNPINNKIDC